MLALHTICGQWVQAGENFTNPFTLLPAYTPRAQAEPPYQAWGYGEKLRVRDLTDAACRLRRWRTRSCSRAMARSGR